MIGFNERDRSMRKFFIVFFIFSLVALGFSLTAYAVDCTQDTMGDQIGDWIASFGRKYKAEDQIRAERKSARVRACAQREAEKADGEARRASEGIKKKFGI